MLCALDVSYKDSSAIAACVAFSEWTAESPLGEYVCPIHGIERYKPGEFFRRELPCLLRVLQEVPEMPELLIIDGYVWLDSQGRPGLGAHLYDQFKGRIPVVGIAKTTFRGSRHAIPVVRGQSSQPLYITAAGMGADAAAAAVLSMHGQYRIPTLLGRVDQLCQGN